MKKRFRQKVTASKLGRGLTCLENMELSLLALPMIIYFFVFHYLPMGGILLAFKDYKYNLGIFDSDWIGLENFVFFFTSRDAWHVTRNTVGYSLLFILLNIFSGAGIALILYEIRSHMFVKYFQTAALLPYFMSWVVVGYIFYAILDPVNGVLNHLFQRLGLETINAYSHPKYWPFILSIAQVFKSVGMNSVVYYAALMGIDASLFEAATIDGAGKLQKIRYISIPSLIPLMIILTLLAIGNIFRGDFGLFYQISMDVGALYPSTDIIDTYVYRSLRTNDVGVTAAIGLVQSIVGLFLITITNTIVKRISPEHSLF